MTMTLLSSTTVGTVSENLPAASTSPGFAEHCFGASLRWQKQSWPI
jgi:hypothetical protein